MGHIKGESSQREDFSSVAALSAMLGLLSPLLATAFVILLFLVTASCARADAPVILTLTSDVESIPADGHSVANISIQAWQNQSLYTGPIQITVHSSLGDLDPSNLTLNNGSGWTHLRAGAAPGTAQVNLQVTTGPRQVILPAALSITFLAPGEHLQRAPVQRYFSMRADDLTYSLDFTRMVALQHAHASYRSLDVRADSITLDTTALELRARSLTSTPMVIRSHGKTVKATRLYVNFTYNTAAALVQNDNGTITLVNFTPDEFVMHPAPSLQPQDAFAAEDNEGSQVLLRGRRMDLYPGNEIDCAGAALFVRGKHIFSLPFYRLALNPFSPDADQYVSLDSATGVGVNIPFYYMLNNRGRGSIRIQHQEQAGYFGTNTQSGWSLGIKQDYGQMGLTGGQSAVSGGTVTLDRLTSPDWGLSWRHNQRLGQAGLFNTYVYSPDHRGFTGNISMYEPVHNVGLSLTTFANHQPGLDTATSLATADLPQQSILKHRVFLNFSASLGMQYTHNPALAFGTTTFGMTPGASANIYVAPMVINRQTTLSPSISTHYFLPSTGGFASANTGITLNHQFGETGNLAITYNWSYSGNSGAIPGYSQQLVTASLYKQFGSRVRISANPSYSITSHSLFSTSYFGYALSPLWTFDIASQMSSGFGSPYNDLQIGVSRAFLGRNLRFFYQGATHKLRFEITAGQF